jgi:2,3-bisphosphoglycerate-independent phosphoglycerate mutase
MKNPKVILTVLDGWGFNQNRTGNAIAEANIPNYNFIWHHFPHTLLSASGESVGLPWGEFGSSEVGHLTIGSGRVIYQNLPKINQAITNGSFYNNRSLNEAIKYAVEKQSTIHLIGLVSSGGVHSHISHIEAILKLIKSKKYKSPVVLHMITDGRDSPPKSAEIFLDKLEKICQNLRIDLRISTVCGRYFSMDRDNHWDRTLKSYEVMVDGKGKKASSPIDALKQAYSLNQTDEFIEPYLIVNESKPQFKLISNQKFNTTIKDKDSLIFFNFRPDRMRQIVELFLFPRQDFPNKTQLKDLKITTLTEYESKLPVNVVIPPEKISNTLTQILSENSLSQLHVAETEKYPHVTYFFGGGNPEFHPEEKWLNVQSPAEQVTASLIEENSKTPFDFILANYANADMVGHTGNLAAAVKGIETIDRQLGILLKNFPDSYLIITADHGNAELMIDPQNNQPNTEHTINPVPFIIAHPSLKLANPMPTPNEPTGIIADVAPTILNIFQLPQPPEMSGYNLLESFGFTNLIDCKQFNR